MTSLYTRSITRQRTVDFGNTGRLSVHSPLTKNTGENLGYRLHFSQLYIVHKRQILDNCVHFSTANNNSQLSLTLSSTIVYISHILIVCSSRLLPTLLDILLSSLACHTSTSYYNVTILQNCQSD